MRTSQAPANRLRDAFHRCQVLVLRDMMEVLGTGAKMTVVRRLRELDYRASYSHAGKYYTLTEAGRWNDHGLWAWDGIRFSRHGTLLATLPYLIDTAPAGRFAEELEAELGVRVHNGLATLHQRGRVERRQLGGAFLYLSTTGGERQLRRHLRILEKREPEVATRPQEEASGLDEELHQFLATLNERQRRLYAGFESLKLGRGGDRKVAKITGLNVKTVARGRRELIAGKIDVDRVRAPGAGRPSAKKTAIVETLEELLADETAGDPITGVKWSRKNPRTLSEELKERGVEASPNTVTNVMRAGRYSLRVNRKSVAETRHPDRDSQFRCLARVKQDFLERQQPVVSNDSKKRELVGDFLNKGRAWRRESADVLMHDFPSYALGVALPYGIYDMACNSGTVLVGTSHDTAAFAVDATGIWLEATGWSVYPRMRDLLILCDSGGSNGYRTRLWKYALWKLASQHGITITVCHYPPRASKWNPADHRRFSFISLNWAGVPLRDYETVLK